jgi:hypothetical protein
MEPVELPAVAVDSSTAADNSASVRAKGRTTVVWAIILVSAVVGSAMWAAPRVWHWYHTRHFREQCQAARKSRDWHTLRLCAGDWAAWDSAAGQAWWYGAEAAQELENLEDVVLCLGNVPPSDPNSLIASVEKANLEWTALNRPLEALATSNRIIGRDPRVTEIQSRVISFYAMTLQRAAMLKAIRSAMDAGAEPKEAYTYLVLADLLMFVNGASLNSRWLSSAPDEMRFKIGLAVNTSQEFAYNADLTGTADASEMDREASRQIEWFLDSAPHDPVLLTFLMYRAYQASDVDRVGELLNQVDQTAIDDHMVWVYRAYYHRAFDEFAAAEDAICEALRLHPLSPLAHHEYASLLRTMQRAPAEVEKEQRLAAAGRALRTQVLRLPSALDITAEMFESLARYAEQCADEQVAAAVAHRLEPRP